MESCSPSLDLSPFSLTCCTLIWVPRHASHSPRDRRTREWTLNSNGNSLFRVFASPLLQHTCWPISSHDLHLLARILRLLCFIA